MIDYLIFLQFLGISVKLCIIIAILKHTPWHRNGFQRAPAHRATVPGAARAICRAGGAGGDPREVPCAPHAEVEWQTRPGVVVDIRKEGNCRR